MSGIVRTEDERKGLVWTVTLDQADLVVMEREQLDMVEDAFWLIEAALARRVEGPLTLPRTGLPIRAALDGEGERGS